MKNNINEVAKTIAKEIIKYPANKPADTTNILHTRLGLTKRESEARLMAKWFLSNVEKISIEDNKTKYNELRDQLIELAIAETGK